MSIENNIWQKRRLRNAGLVGILGILLNSCGKEETKTLKNENDLSVTQHKTVIEEANAKEVPIEDIKRYFPLKEENTWTYIKKLAAEDVTIYCCSNIKNKEGFFFFSGDKGNTRKAKISEETYTIVKKYELPRSQACSYEVKIEGENPRDGRYDQALQPIDLIPDSEGNISTGRMDPQIMWTYVEGETGFFIMETMNQPYFVKYGKTKYILPLVVFEPKTYVDEERWGDLAFGSKMYKGEISVPAGKFKDILGNIRLVGAKNIEDVLLRDSKPVYEDNHTACFRTDSFYAKNIGLVKEVQYDREGKVTYTLELKNFKVR